MMQPLLGSMTQQFHPIIAMSKPPLASWSKERKRPSSTVEVVKGSRSASQIKRKYQDPVLLQARLRLTKTGKVTDSSPRLLGRGQEMRGEQAAKSSPRDSAFTAVERHSQTTARVQHASPTSEATSIPCVRPTRPPLPTTKTQRAWSSSSSMSVQTNRQALRPPKAIPTISPSPTKHRNTTGESSSHVDPAAAAVGYGGPGGPQGPGGEHLDHLGHMQGEGTFSCLPCRVSSFSHGRARPQHCGSDSNPGPRHHEMTTSCHGGPPDWTARLARSFPLKSNDRSMEEAAQLGSLPPPSAQIKEGETRVDSRPTCLAPSQPWETSAQAARQADRRVEEGGDDPHQNSFTCSEVESTLCPVDDEDHDDSVGDRHSERDRRFATLCADAAVVEGPRHRTTTPRAGPLTAVQRGTSERAASAPECSASEWGAQWPCCPPAANTGHSNNTNNANTRTNRTGTSTCGVRFC
ncbi:uncharacterized protein LOC125298286 [Alosa alosa]|uniref:uncharacterized protein LOC125298286 n=1 Tax=Alosa alosa TaxID=278164 RepID=UPI002015099C|nr:uncharacterized protein LOC125298286 [Alosa alosa]